MNLSFLKEKKNKVLIISLVILLVLVFFIPASSEDEIGTVGTTESGSTSEVQKQLERVLSAMEGVGEVEVMITFEPEESSLFGGSSGNSKVCGVVIVADGAGSAVVETRILNAVKALFSIDAHKISIVKRAK